MKYKVKEINSISKLTIINFNHAEKYGINSNSTLNKIFWRTIFSHDNLQNFIENKLLKFKKETLSDKDFFYFIEEYKFILSKLKQTKNGISFLEEDHLPSGQEVFFSYRIFSTILGYYNDYYKESGVHISLSNGIIFLNESGTINDFIKNIEGYTGSKFVGEVLNDMILKNIGDDFDNHILFKIHIYWPNELTLISIIAKTIKQKYKNAKIVVDFSGGNEQFDFTQWVDSIKNSGSLFFENIDYYIVSRDYGKGVKLLLSYLNNEISEDKLRNIIYYNGGVKFIDFNDNGTDHNIFEQFIETNFNTNNISELLGDKCYTARLVPYKCYWDNCNFCAINSHNKFVLNKNYSYEYFINLWCDFIKKHNISSVGFLDEAIPPMAILFFAKKVIKEGIKIKYFFRTRFEIQYTTDNLKIIQQSGARFCGMGLESASERINEEIGNKGNSSVDIREKMKKIHFMDRIGIAIHNYSIMGFPGETKEEYIQTYKFLKNNIVKSKQYTCSPNIFCLMKGPKIFSEMEKYGVTVEKKDLENPFMLSYPFKHNGESRDMDLLNKLVNDLHRVQFVPWLNPEDKVINYSDFWSYIDRSSMFYKMKEQYKINPYYLYKNINQNIINQNFDIKLQSNFKLSTFFQIIENKEFTDKIDLYDWCLCGHIYLPTIYKNLFINYSEMLSLKENLDNNGIKNHVNLKYFINILIENRILILSELKFDKAG